MSLLVWLLFQAQEDVRPWIEKLKDPNPEVRDSAEKRLEELGEKDLKVLLPYRADPDPEIRSRVERVVRKLDWKTRVAQLERYVRENFEKRPEIKKSSLREVDPPSSLKSFVRCFELSITYDQSHPEAKGALMSSRRFLLRSFDDSVYRVHHSEDLLRLARAVEWKVRTAPEVAAFLDLAVGRLASLETQESREGEWEIRNHCSGRPGYFLYRLKVDREGRPVEVQSLGFVPYGK